MVSRENSIGDSPKAIGARIKAGRERLDMTQKQFADSVGSSEISVSGWERGIATPGRKNFALVAATIGLTENELRYGTASAPAEATEAGSSHKNTIGRPRLRPAPYARVHEYLERMQAAGMPEPAIDEAERYLVDSNFGQINKRDYRERSDEEVIGDIDMMWMALKVRFERDYGVRL